MTKELPILVAEIGINSGGSVDVAKKTISMVYEAVRPHYPLDRVYIKFQKRNPDKSVPHHMWDTPRKSLLTGQMTNYITYKWELEHNLVEYLEIDDYIKSYYTYGKPNWFVSVWDLDSVKWVQENFIDMPYLKIPSAHLTNHELVLAASKVAATRLIVSTGMSTREEVINLLGHLEYAPTLLHCNSSYPCADNETDLNAVQDLYRILWDAFGTSGSIGFSSHSPSPYPAIYSNFFNVSMIEFHVTLDRATEGSDHAASLEKGAIELLARETARIPVVRGKEQLKVYDSELSKRKSLRGY